MRLVARFCLAALVLVGCGPDAPPRSGVAPAATASAVARPAPKAPKLVAIEAGRRSTCGITDAGAVWCWGWTLRGPSSVPRRVTGLENVAEVSIAPEHWCARLAGGGVRCWGTGPGAGMPPQTPREGFYTPPDIEDAQRLASNDTGTCALRSGGRVTCWGVRPHLPRFDSREVLDVSLPGPATALAAGGNNLCALVHGTPWCWSRSRFEPKRVMHGGYETIAIGAQGGLCAVTEAGQLDCVGRPCHPAHGTWHPKPCHKGLKARVSDVAAGRHWCARVGATWSCWGDNFGGAVKQGGLNRVDQPTPIPVAADFVDLALGWAHSCTLGRDGGVTCWGSDYRGELGRGAPAWLNRRYVLNRKTSSSSALAVGENHICIAQDPAPVCWGTTRTKTEELGPTGPGGRQISLAAGATRVTSGGRTACGAREGAVVCWGDGYDKEPFVAPMEHVHQLSGSPDAHCAIAGAERRLWCWGKGYYLSLGGTENRISGGHEPAVLDDAVPVAAVGVGSRHACWVRSDGALWCRGTGTRGVDGKRRATQKSVQLTELPGARHIVAGEGFTCAADGAAVWCWGHNHHGVVGSGTWALDVPLTKLSLAGVRDLSAMVKHVCAVTTDGAVWCWGDNKYGQLGSGDRLERNVPTRVLGVSGAVGVRAADHGTCAIEEDGDVVCWGELPREVFGDENDQHGPAPALAIGTEMDVDITREVLPAR